MARVFSHLISAFCCFLHEAHGRNPGSRHYNKMVLCSITRRYYALEGGGCTLLYLGLKSVSPMEDCPKSTNPKSIEIQQVYQV